MAAAADRLSVLPDGVLLRILSLAPAKEAAATTALSRRWRPLWRRAAALNLDSRPYSANQDGYYSPSFDDFFSNAIAALAAFRRRRQPRRRARIGLTRLTLFLQEGTYRLSWQYRASGADPDQDDGQVAALLADPALAALEELAIACCYKHLAPYNPPIASLPCAATLRMLDLNQCNLEPLAMTTTLAFPRLTHLRLEDCYLLQGYLQAMVDAAPALTDLSLVNVTHRPPDHSKKTSSFYYGYIPLPFCLRCPTATALVLHIPNDAAEEFEPSADKGIEFDMPSMRFFRYRGYPIKLSLTAPVPQLARVDLDASVLQQRAWRYQQPALHMLPSLSNTTTLKLRLHHIENLVVVDNEIVLPTFPNLKLLDLDAKYEYMDNKTAVAMARLLRSCPGLAELRLRLNMGYDYHHERRTEAAQPVGGPFVESMDRFERLAPMSGAHHSNMEISEVSDLSDAMTNNCAFRCLQTSLRKVSLQFEAKEVNCFQVQLAKFLVENAMVLEEMHVHDGGRFWPDHLLHKMARWRADSFRRRNLTDTAGFRVYQLANPVVDSKEHGYM